MARLLYLISWTGWTREDWREALYKLTPLYWMSKTGWSRDDWAFEVKEACKVLGIMALFWLGLCAIFAGLG